MTTTYLQQTPAENLELYEQDYCLWLETTIEKLKARSFEQVDWEILLEELDSLVRSDRRELKNRLTVLLMHILKYQYQSKRRSSSWVSTIIEQHLQINSLLEDSPSLKPYYQAIFADCYAKAIDAASAETNLPVSTFPSISPFLPVDVLNLAFISSLVNQDEV